MHTERDARNDTQSEQLCENYKLLVKRIVYLCGRLVASRYESSRRIIRRLAPQRALGTPGTCLSARDAKTFHSQTTNAHENVTTHHVPISTIPLHTARETCAHIEAPWLCPRAQIRSNTPTTSRLRRARTRTLEAPPTSLPPGAHRNYACQGA